MSASAQRFDFPVEPRFARPLALMGVRADRAHVEVTERELRVRFGPWRVRTPRSNVTGFQIGGPYRWWRVIGPHLSLADGGLTLGTNTRRGVCLELRVPVRGMEPLGLVRHRGITVTVADPDALVRALGL
ncbi:hypothetical protein HDA32_003210 [Spinactinospora alkalitolerans]|uniref:Uncharacterized protein n=1 Tax=Spinactinospora alkalitolerans TaxID=687207 RepID=A0A852U286_9ACTN|nr:hypothetical protein [Spinactinospora alkalitolerans]NYE48090.1 hypothetical protein [Spinactinospora alkalitolerans]